MHVEYSYSMKITVFKLICTVPLLATTWRIVHGILYFSWPPAFALEVKAIVRSCFRQDFVLRKLATSDFTGWERALSQKCVEGCVRPCSVGDEDS